MTAKLAFSVKMYIFIFKFIFASKIFSVHYAYMDSVRTDNELLLTLNYCVRVDEVMRCICRGHVGQATTETNKVKVFRTKASGL